MKQLMLEYRVVESKKNKGDFYAIAKYMDVLTGFIYPDVFCPLRPGIPRELKCPCLVEASIMPKPERDGKMTLHIVAIDTVSAMLDLSLIFDGIDLHPVSSLKA